MLKQVKSWEQWSQICSLNAVLVTTVKISSVLGATARLLNYAPSLFILSKIGFSFIFDSVSNSFLFTDFAPKDKTDLASKLL